MKRRYIYLLILILQANSARAAWLANQRADIRQRFGLSIVTDTAYQCTWDLRYKSCDDTDRLKVYLELVQNEYGKYPAGYFKKIGIYYLVIGTDFRIVGQQRAAVPDPYRGALFFAVDSMYTPEYLVYVMHHELNHCTEYAVWSSMYYKWKKWERKNPCRFEYGSGGGSAYEMPDKLINWRAYTHPRKGFVNLYSTTGEEEDRSEIVSLIMTDSGRVYLCEFSRKDRRLRRKIRLALKFLDKASGTKDNYWRREMSS